MVRLTSVTKVLVFGSSVSKAERCAKKKNTGKEQMILKYRDLNEDATKYGGTSPNPGLPRQPWA